MFKLKEHNVTIILDGLETEPSRISIDVKNKTIVYMYTIEYSGRDDCKRTVVVKVDSEDRFLQATFKCEHRHVAIVNATNKSLPIKFDGFVDYETDDSKTKPFTIHHLNSLAEDHRGVGVKRMAKAMSGDTRLMMYLNEAIMPQPKTHNAWYMKFLPSSSSSCKRHRFDSETLAKAELELCKDIFETDDESDNDDDYLVVRDSSSKANNFTHWASVDCRTGPRIATVELLFHFVLTATKN
ncbi:unknown [Spodoptera litura nucleopolyhedrovirus]|uniref:Uncharacterized protein n=1 Tax=Spodoptera litura multicapsid nucleopolyhedrovirus TaxID=46242 RepID=Q91BB4_NPVST|nr:hypothetical protein [Spodoptera litura nucleopolyhedrovirus]AAL01801.1 unknown [Spodoptera litura nucleopolyhedrovirus]